MKSKDINQLSLFEVITYAGRHYWDLKSAMISAMQDFYIRKILPQPIVIGAQEFNLKQMKKYWKQNELEELYY